MLSVVFCARAGARVCVACVFVCVCIGCLHVYVCMYVCMCSCVYACLFQCVCVCVGVHIKICVVHWFRLEDCISGQHRSHGLQHSAWSLENSFCHVTTFYRSWNGTKCPLENMAVNHWRTTDIHCLDIFQQLNRISSSHTEAISVIEKFASLWRRTIANQCRQAKKYVFVSHRIDLSVI